MFKLNIDVCTPNTSPDLGSSIAEQRAEADISGC